MLFAQHIFHSLRVTRYLINRYAKWLFLIFMAYLSSLSVAKVHIYSDIFVTLR